MRVEMYIEKLATTLSGWFQPDNYELKRAIEQTVDEGYFSFPDVKHQIRTLKLATTFNQLNKWAEISGLKIGSLKHKHILCLHAGNLPLVGFQDALSVIMTGGNYFGKISRKDPYLLPAFLEYYKQHKGANDGSVDWCTNLDNITVEQADALLFAGSEISSGQVKSLLTKKRIICGITPSLMRTAHFSVALITDNRADTMRDLTEAVFRYGGEGCRSVAIVVAPFHLNEEKCSFTDYVEQFWLQNPQHSKPASSLFHRFAFNKAIGIEQAWLDDFLIEEHLSKPVEKYVLKWVKGDKNTLDVITKKFRSGIQSIYSTKEYIGQSSGELVIEPLSSAQTPPIWWKPDQIDTISWLQENAGI